MIEKTDPCLSLGQNSLELTGKRKALEGFREEAEEWKEAAGQSESSWYSPDHLKECCKEASGKMAALSSHVPHLFLSGPWSSEAQSKVLGSMHSHSRSLPLCGHI